jgi:hypothetical protein
MNDTPVLLFVYNRLHTTAQVFESIANARPSTLLVVADGPKADDVDDASRCEAVRQLVCEPHWKCDLRVNLATSNLGFKRRISSGLDWALSQFDEIIVVEDDCVPERTFFPFCTELLARYRHDERVMMIAGCNFQFGRRRGNASYYASRAVGTWGWATWRRAFRHFDPDMRAWPVERDGTLLGRTWPVAEMAAYWRDRLDEAYQGRVDTWDYQWAFSMWRAGGLQLASNVNLIHYIGCLPDTAHTSNQQAAFCRIPTTSIAFPLQHPTDLTPDLGADVFEFYRVLLNQDADEADRRSADAERSVAGRRVGLA